MAVTGSLESEARRSALVADLLEHGILHLAASAATWGVHTMTIRRDFDSIVNAGLARRVRGGIVSVQSDPFSQRVHMHSTAKKTIAAKLRTLVHDDSTIGLDASTTIYALTERLDGFSGISAITNGMSSFQRLLDREGVRAFLTGGERDEHNDSLVGSLAVQALGQFNFDVVFLSAMSVDPALGTSEQTVEQVAIKQTMARAAALVVLAVDSTKFDTRSRARSLLVDDFDVLVTDLDPSDVALDPYRSAVEQIL